VFAAFSDVTGISVKDSFNIAGGFGGGAGAGELCGALCGGVMVLGAMHPTEDSNPTGSRREVQKMGKELLSRFSENFDAVRCAELLKKRAINHESSVATAKAMGLTNHCSIMIVTTVELVAELLREQGYQV